MSSLRPLCFVVVVWGERFRRYLTEYCLPSLLSPNNIPALSGGRRNRFIVCTTPNDWTAVARSPVFARLERYITPTFIEIPPQPPDRSGCEHMGVGHERAARLLHEERAYGVFVTPDLMLSDGSAAALERHARTGRPAVLCAAFRFGEEPLFERFHAMRLIPARPQPTGFAEEITLTGRQMVSAMLASFHSEGVRYGWESPAFADLPAVCWWRVPGEEGIVVHSLSWTPLLVDYAVIEEHDTTVFETWTLDGDYLYRNFGDRPEIHVVTDSDEIMLVSWAPLEEYRQSVAPSRLKRLPVAGEWLKGAILRGALTSGIFDPLKRRIFFQPVRWHARDLTPAWDETERRAARILARYAGDLSGGTPTARVPPTLAALGALGRLWMVSADVAGHSDRLRLRLAQVARGDLAAAGRLGRRVRTMWTTVRGGNVRHRRAV